MSGLDIFEELRYIIELLLAEYMFAYFFAKKKKEFDVHNMTPDEQLKFEIAQELGLDEKVLQKGWKSLTSKESGRIGGMITGRKRQLKEEALKES